MVRATSPAHSQALGGPRCSSCGEQAPPSAGSLMRQKSRENSAAKRLPSCWAQGGGWHLPPGPYALGFGVKGPREGCCLSAELVGSHGPPHSCRDRGSDIYHVGFTDDHSSVHRPGPKPACSFCPHPACAVISAHSTRRAGPSVASAQGQPSAYRPGAAYRGGRWPSAP